MTFNRFIFLFLLCFFSISAFAQSSAELKRRKAALSKEIELLKKEQKKIAGNKKLSLRQIDALNSQIRLREEKINTIGTEIRLLESQIRQNTQTVHNLQSRLEQLKTEYAAMTRFAYKNNNAVNRLMFIFASNSFNQAFKRIKYLKQFSEEHRRQAQKITGTQKEIGHKIEELDKNKQNKNELLVSEQEEKQTLNKEKTTQSQQLARYDKKESELKKQVDARSKELIRINKSISIAINREIEAERKRLAAKARAEAAAKAAKEKAERERAEKQRLANIPANASKSSTPAKADKSKKAIPETKASEKEAPVAVNIPTVSSENLKLASDFSNNRGRLPRPTNGPVIQHFGMNSYGSVKVQNNGIDIKSSPGAVVHSVFSGEVRRVLGDLSGSIIIIRHGTYFSVYSNLASVQVSTGQTVSAGQTIGTVRSNPEDGSSQLHFEIWNGNRPVNPEGWIR